jgi:hypothetical protein
MASLRGLVLQRPYQRTKHFAQALALGENWLQIHGGKNSDAFRQNQVSLQFL